MFIYKMTNKVNGKIYIGQTTRSLEVRMCEHIRHNKIIVDKAIHKYGIESFIIEIIDKALTMEELNNKETYWIEYYNSITPNGYNQCLGGNNTQGYKHKKESKVKMSKAKQGKLIGDKNPFCNKHHKEATIEKWKEIRKGLKHLTEDQIKTLRNSHYKTQVINIETKEIFNSIKDAALKYSIEPTHITRVCKGKRKSCGGYHWKYV